MPPGITVPDKKAEILSVTELNRFARRILEASLPEIWVSGELSNLNLSQSGHVYLKLKDDKSQINGVIFDGTGLARRLKLANGQQVEARGRVSLYEKTGNYQIYIEEVRPAGLGNLHERFEALKKKLQDEGLFDSARKKTLPMLPQCIGIVSSIDGAALHDFKQVLYRRFPNMHLRIIDSRVQGEGAALQITRALRFLNRTKACDVIVITRGGGSMEDLWCFNDENLVRQVAASTIPVISAVGHEIDFTLCDFAADHRAPTPSAAAEEVVRSKEEFVDQIQYLQHRLNKYFEGQIREGKQYCDQLSSECRYMMQEILQDARHRLAQLQGHYLFRKPENYSRMQSERLMNLQEKLNSRGRSLVAHGKTRLQYLQQRHLMTRPDKRIQQDTKRLEQLNKDLAQLSGKHLDQQSDKLKLLHGKLMTLSPEAVLDRGYAILQDADQNIISDPQMVKKGQQLKARLKKGDLDLEVS